MCNSVCTVPVSLTERVCARIGDGKIGMVDVQQIPRLLVTDLYGGTMYIGAILITDLAKIRSNEYGGAVFGIAGAGCVAQCADHRGAANCKGSRCGIVAE